MAERMLEYAVLLRRDLRRSGWMSAVRARAVAHVPLVAYSGRAAWNAPPDIERHGGWMPRELALLCSQAGRRFGAATGAELASVLADVEDSDELARVGALIIDCGSGSDLLAQARPR